MTVDLNADPGGFVPEGAVILTYEIPPLRAIYRAVVTGATCTIDARNALTAIKPNAKIRTATLNKFTT